MWSGYVFPLFWGIDLHLTGLRLFQVKADQSGAEPGWVNGECNGKSGWFPEAYVQAQEDEAVDAQPSVSTWAPLHGCFSLLVSFLQGDHP